MKHYFIKTLGRSTTEGWCVLHAPPEGLGVSDYRLAEGDPIGSRYPSDARIYMSDESSGIRLGSLIGNTKSFLIVATVVKEVIEQHCAGVEIEYLPFTLYNHKKREHSRDYWIVNPIGTRDVLNLKASEIEYLNKPGDPYHGAVVGVDKFVLDSKKLKDIPALFRIKEAPSKYVINELLAQAFQERQFTNMLLKEIEQQLGE